ncbi:MAG: ATP-binding protein [Xanthomonadales bacterium]|nr:ATP-binding protein [Xanthomonadales bacterium]
MSRPLLVAWSGGKDAAFALARLRADPEWRVAGLLTTFVDEGAGGWRVASHGLRRDIIAAQARALGLPLFEMRQPPKAANDVYLAALAEALATARAAVPGLAHLAHGDLALADLRAWREATLAELGWQALFPLWGEDTAVLARRMIADGWRAILCCVDTAQLDPAFCGRDFDPALLANLPAGCDPCGENGEFHTCAYAGPLWSQPLALLRGARVRREGRFECIELLP